VATIRRAAATAGVSIQVLPRDAMLLRDIIIQYVTSRYCIETVERIELISDTEATFGLSYCMLVAGRDFRYS